MGGEAFWYSVLWWSVISHTARPVMTDYTNGKYFGFESTLVFRIGPWRMIPLVWGAHLSSPLMQAKMAQWIQCKLRMPYFVVCSVIHVNWKEFTFKARMYIKWTAAISSVV
jgi:hypothetical protein